MEKRRFHKYLTVIFIFILFFVILKLNDTLPVTESPNLTPDRFPVAFDGWVSKEIPVSDVEKEFLPADTQFVKRVYSQPDYGEIFLQVVLSGQDRRSIHQPEACLPAQGWVINKKSKYPVKVDNSIGNLITARIDVSFGKDERKHNEIFLYWFMGNKRITNSYLKRILLIGFDRCILRKNFQWAMLRVSTNSTSVGTNVALKRLEKFIVDLFPKISSPDSFQF